MNYEITVTVDCESSKDKKAVETTIKKFAKLNVDDRSRIAQLIESPKALQGLADNWGVLEGMFK